MPGTEDSKEPDSRGKVPGQPDPLAQLWPKEVQPGQVNPVASGGDDMIDSQRGVLAVSAGGGEQYPIAVARRTEHGVLIEDGDPAESAIAQPPCP